MHKVRRKKQTILQAPLHQVSAFVIKYYAPVEMAQRFWVDQYLHQATIFSNTKGSPFHPAPLTAHLI